METKIIPLARPDIRTEDIEAAVKVMESGMLVQGKEVLALEQSIAGYVGVPYCSAVSNGTASLHLALLALGIGKGDEVIVPALSYVATANVVELVGTTCVFVDTHPRHFNIDVDKIEAVITPATKAIIPVHEFGLCADMTAVMDIARRHNLYIIEDAACALGATWNGKAAGSFGDFGSFSLHPRKAISSGEGGLLTSHQTELDLKIKTLRNHGIAPGSYPMDFVEAGFNYRMTDFQAALVHSQFRRLDTILAYKNKLAAIYSETIRNPAVTLPVIPDGAQHTWQTYHILLQNEAQRNELMAYLKENGILTNYGAQCIPAMTYYRNKYNLDTPNKFPNTWKAYTCGLALPIYERLTEEDIHYIANTINNFQPSP